MARRPEKIFTIFHVLEKRGEFDSNPANAQAVNVDGLSIYKGPVEYPKMIYHPKGERELVQAGTAILTRDGEFVRDPKTNEPRRTGDVWGTKHKVVQNHEEYLEWRGRGWCDTEAESLRMNVETASRAPPKTLVEQQAEELAALKEKLAKYETAVQAVVPHKSAAAR